MKRVFYLTAIAVFLPLILPAQAPRALSNSYPFRAADLSTSPRIARLRADIQKSGTMALEEFWDEMRRNGTPIIEPIPNDEQHSRVTFVWRGSGEARNVVITDGVSIGVGDAEPRNSEMTRLADTDVWYRTYDVRNDARFTYSLSENDPLTSFVDPNRKSNSKADPLNSHRFLTGQTYVELSDAPPQPWVVPLPAEMSGNVEMKRFNNHNVWAYTPHNFQPTGETYPLVVVMGGAAYMNFVSVPVILDNLIAEKRIPPVVAVVVGGSGDELSCSPAYANFLADEVVPWMRKTYHATDEPDRTVIGGSSLGGLASTFAAVNHPDVFGKVLSQSGSYWWKPDIDMNGEWLTRQIGALPRRPVEFFLEVGLMESSEFQLETNRRMRDALKSKGYTVHYQEFNGNHNYINWRGSFSDGLVVLLGN